MKPGWSEQLCRHEFSEGKREVQHKWATITERWDDESRRDVHTTVAAA